MLSSEKPSGKLCTIKEPKSESLYASLRLIFLSKYSGMLSATIAEKSDDSETNIGAKVKGYIAMYATEIKSTGEIAKHFGYHPVYLESVFKKKTGQTIHSAIIDERIKIACRWLLNTNATLDVIAENTGFSSRTHFCTIFKAKTGLTPSVWRRQHSK